MQIFVDMDGVLADFDRGYAALFGPHGGKEADDVDWLVRNTPGVLNASLPPMPDFDVLWAALEARITLSTRLVFRRAFQRRPRTSGPGW